MTPNKSGARYKKEHGRGRKHPHGANSRKGKQTKAARRRRQRRAECGHACKQQVLMSKADKQTAAIEERLTAILEPHILNYAQATQHSPTSAIQTLKETSARIDYLALSKEARRQRIRQILETGYQKALEREAIVLKEGQYNVKSS